MKTIIRFHEEENKPNKDMGEIAQVFRKDDVLVIDGKYYRIEDSEYDLTKKEIKYWVEFSCDEHPSAPNLEF